MFVPSFVALGPVVCPVERQHAHTPAVGHMVLSSKPKSVVYWDCCTACVEGETSSRWCGVETWIEGRQLRCRPRHLTEVKNDEFRPKIALALPQNCTLI
ncbi:hypothetical protein AVEN_180323-1 [Araneus ventricosus]|uniref:Uncharacterized protein n=1 Tax=Araneus ventricosus TaxID=182803 RepID=A0A4Y2WBH2_ARAVE|nr:hypothetical protein AVEN_180323-1 [Araneus ventricosus]